MMFSMWRFYSIFLVTREHFVALFHLVKQELVKVEKELEDEELKISIAWTEGDE